MPRVSRRVKRRSAGYDEEHIRQLLHGYVLWGPGFGRGDQIDEAAAKEAWQILREKLLADWIAKHPGQRPQAPGSLRIGER